MMSKAKQAREKVRLALSEETEVMYQNIIDCINYAVDYNELSIQIYKYELNVFVIELLEFDNFKVTQEPLYEDVYIISW